MSLRTPELEQIALHEQRFREAFDGTCWKGPDITTTQTVTLEPKRMSTIPIELGPEHYPPRLDLVEPIQGNLSLSARSRDAQCGIHPFSIKSVDSTRPVAWNGLNYDDWEKITQGEHIQALAVVGNSSARPTRIQQGQGIFRLYTGESLVHLLTNDETEEYIAQGDIQIDGEYRMNGSGILVKPDHTWTKWIPPSPDNTPIDVPTDKLYRPQIEQYLEDVPLSYPEPIFWLTRTPYMKLSSRVNALIHPALEYNHLGQLIRSMGRHANSLVIDAGTSWPVILELNTLASVAQNPPWIHFSFARSYSAHV